MLVALPFELGQRQGGELCHGRWIHGPADIFQLPRQVVDQLAQRFAFVVGRAAPLTLELGQPRA
jgi:hypothetical protein